MARAPLALLLAAGLLCPAPCPAFTGDKDTPAGSSPESAGAEENRITPEQQAAIDRGLAWLATQQKPDGSFPANNSADYQTAVTSLATLAFLGAGHGLRSGPTTYRRTVRASVEWLLKAQANSGFKGYISFGGDNQSKMHGHGFATMALAEAFGTAGATDSPRSIPRDEEERDFRRFSQDLRKGIQSAVECIEKSQALQGGWYYTPSESGASDHEGSVTVCEVQALLAASNRGFVVSMERIRRAREYMKRSQASSGGFKYQLSTIEEPGRSRESFALTAAGITTIVGLAEYDRRDALEKAYRYLDLLRRPDFDGGQQYAFYGSYYGVQAYHLAGGLRWRNFWIPLRRTLIRNQNREGSWEGTDTTGSLGPVYPTAFSLLMLEVPIGYLSVYAK